MYLVSFCLGGVLQKNLNLETLKIHTWLLRVSVVIGLLILFVLLHTGNKQLSDIYTFIKFVVGIIVVVCVSTLLHFQKPNLVSRQLKFIGNYSATIYFIHIYFYEVYEQLMYRYYVNSSPLVYWFFVLSSMAVGVYGPILVDKYLISKSRIAGFLIVGRKIKGTVPQIQYFTLATQRLYNYIKKPIGK